MKKLWGCTILCVVLIQCAQTATPKQPQCSDISGEYNFLGRSVEQLDASLSPDLRFDEKAMAMMVRTVIEPHTVVITQDVTSGNVSVDVIGKSAEPDSRLALMSAKLPLSATFSCGQDGWTRDTLLVGGGGGGRTSETKHKAVLRLVAQGLLLEGSRTISTGTLPRRTVTDAWRIVFAKRA